MNEVTSSWVTRWAGSPRSAGVAELSGLPVGGSRRKVTVANRRVKGDDVAEVGEPRTCGEIDGEPGQVEHAAFAAGVFGDHDESAARAKHGVAGGEDLGHRHGVGVAAGMADVGPVGRVVEGVGWAEPAARQPGRLVDHPGVARVRRGGDDQVDLSGAVAQDLGEMAGVAVANLGSAALLAGQHVVEVLLGEGDPALFELHADGAPVEQGSLDSGGADPGQGVDDEGAGVGVFGDDAPGELGEHLARMAGAVRQVAAGALPLGGGLGHRPDGQRNGRGGAGVVDGHGRPTTGQASAIEQGVGPCFWTISSD